MNTVFLITGSNLGNCVKTLQLAVEAIEMQCGRILQKSRLYETAAWGIEDQPTFYNQVLQLETSLLPEDLMQTLLQIEKDLGRTRGTKFGPRVIDIDILLYNNIIISNNIVTIPHPHMQERRFVLTPLNEIAPNIIHPVLQKTVQQLLMECKDSLAVRSGQ